MNAKPTKQAYTELQTAYDFFNRKLFSGKLPPCLITMQRKNRTLGYFSGNRWADRTGAVTDEIAMNPMHFSGRSVEDVLSTLAHEMAHLWQHHCGTSSRNGYHNREWGAKMDEIGLCPSQMGAYRPDGQGQAISACRKENRLNPDQARRRLPLASPRILHTATEHAAWPRHSTCNQGTCISCGCSLSWPSRPALHAPDPSM